MQWVTTYCFYYIKIYNLIDYVLLLPVVSMIRSSIAPYLPILVYDFLLVSLHFHVYFVQCKNHISLKLSFLFVFVGFGCHLLSCVLFLWWCCLGVLWFWGVNFSGVRFWLFLYNTKLIPLSYDISYCRTLFRALEH